MTIHSFSHELMSSEASEMVGLESPFPPSQKISTGAPICHQTTLNLAKALL